MSRTKSVDVSGDPKWRQEWADRGMSPCVGRLMLHQSPHGNRTILFCRPFNLKRSRKGRKRSKARIVNLTTHDRYREDRPAQRPNFFGTPSGKKITTSTILGKTSVWTNNVKVSSANVLPTGTPLTSESSKRTWDTIHPPPYGSFCSPFFSTTLEFPHSQSLGQGTYRSRETSPGSWWQYDGYFIDDGSWGSDDISAYRVSSPPALSGYDTLAWDSLKPHVSNAGLAQFIYELKDLPGQLATTANLLHNSWRSFGGGYSTTVMHPKSVADNFLNHEFGWLPFLNDMAKLYDTFVNAQSYLAKLIDQNRRWVRKRRVLESKEVNTLVTRVLSSGTIPSSNQAPIDGMCKTYQLDGNTCTGHFEIRKREVTDTWATGQFMYYRPEFDINLPDYSSDLLNVSRLMTLYGLRINPTLLWKITPWTWTIDWFTNFGSFLQRLDDFTVDGIVSRNLCVMKTTRKFVTKTSFINFERGPITLHWQRSLTNKQRRVADSPYGFNPWNNISLRQWAILGAIGITRSGSGFISRGA